MHQSALPYPADPTIPLQDAGKIDQAKLAQYLRQNAPQVGKVVEMRQFPGGFSNLTFLLRCTEGEFVLRCPPAGADIRSAHDMGREFRVLSLLYPHNTKVPCPVAYCGDAEVVGTPFYLMTKMDGVILRAPNAPQMDLSPTLLQQIGERMIDHLADLHALDIRQTGLLALGKPEGYVHRQVEGWISRYQAARTDDLPAMEKLVAMLPAQLPPEQPPTLLHNDYKHDNLVLHPHDLTQIVALLDWEMATVGDPLMDLGATLAYWIEPDDAPLARAYNLTWLPGNLTRPQVVEHYARRTGRDVTHWRFYYAFGLFKNAVIAQQIYARWKRGDSQDARFGHLLPMIEYLGAKAAQVANGDADSS